MVVTDRGERGADHPALLPLLALIGGIHAAVSTGTPLRFAPLVILLILLPLSCHRCRLFLLVAIGVAGGWGYATTAGRLEVPATVQTLLREAGREPVTLAGTVVEPPRRGEWGSRFPLRLSNPGYEGTEIMLFLPDDWRGRTPRVGERIRVRARLREIAPRGLPGERDPRTTDHLRGRFVSGSLPLHSSIETIGTDPRWQILAIIDRLRERAAAGIDRAMSPRSGAVARAVILGDRSHLSREDEERFARAGVNHILSVSGFHVGVFAATLVMLIRIVARLAPPLLLWVDLRRWSILVSIPAVLFYLLLTGSSPATLRSVLMFLLLAGVLVRETECHLLDVLILSAMIMLVNEPALLYSPSFQLSFAALWGIVTLSPLLVRSTRVPPGSRWLPLLQLTVVSVSAIAATAPLVAWHFGTFSIAGVIANPLIVPLLGYLTVVGGFAGVITTLLFPPLGNLILAGISGVISLSLLVVDLCARIPVLDRLNPSPPLLLLTLAGLLIVTLYRHQPVVMALFAGVTLSLSTVHLVSASAHDPSLLRVTFLSLGQAEATLFRLPGGETILVDTGGRLFGDNAGFSGQYLIPALRRLDVREIDSLILSHPHPDHIGGVAELIARFPVNEVIGHRETLSRLGSHAGGPLSRLRTLDGNSAPLVVGGAVLTPLWPLPEGAGGDVNDRSLVIRIGWGAGGVLLAGDIGWEVADHLATIRGEELPSTILKIPHHGSRHSNAPRFVERVSPRLAVIFAGRENRFGLPSAEAIAELHARRIPLWRTDLDGTLTVVIDRQGRVVSIRRQSD